MDNKKWILNEIETWQKEEIISSETATTLKQRYSINKNSKLLVILFSVIGSILIGLGIILIFAKNWYLLPFALKIVLAFLPLVISQGFLVYTVKRKNDNLAWREPVAILTTASIFATIALISQIFHLSGNFGNYTLLCGLLSVPLIFILDAVSPLLVYYWAILTWGGNEIEKTNNGFSYEAIQSGLILLLLFSIGVLYLIKSYKQDNTRLGYVTLITFIASFPLFIMLAVLLKSSILIMVLCYFALLISFNFSKKSVMLPSKFIGIFGAIITLLVATNSFIWRQTQENISIIGVSSLAIIFLVILHNANFCFKADKYRFSLIIALSSLALIRYCAIIYTSFSMSNSLFFVIASNSIALLVGIGFIVYGTKKSSLLFANTGMASTCVLIIMRFFDSDMDFLWRGVVFLALGLMFLLVNLSIVRTKKQNKEAIET